MVQAQDLATALAQALRSLPRGWTWGVDLISDGLQDGILTIRAPDGRTAQLAVQVKTRFLPSEFAAALPKYRQRAWLLAAPTIGPRSRELMEEAGLSWLELAGSDVRIAAGGLYIERLLRKERRAESGEPGRRYVAAPFSGKALRIVRWLLIEPDRDWNLGSMAERADVSLGFVSRTFATLVRDAYLGRRPGATRVTDREALLDAWASAPGPREQRFERVFVGQGPMGPLSAIRSLGGRVTRPSYALTAEAAAEQLAPFVRWNQVELYVDEVEKWDQLLDLQPVPRGGNVVLLRSSDDWVFDGVMRFGDLLTVSRPQLYVDLKGRGGAAAEAADFLRERGELWPK